MMSNWTLSFFKKVVSMAHYSTIRALDIDLNRNMIVWFLPSVQMRLMLDCAVFTVIEILLTFYPIGHGGGDIDPSVVMLHLFLVLIASNCIRYSSVSIPLYGVFLSAVWGVKLKLIV